MDDLQSNSDAWKAYISQLDRSIKMDKYRADLCSIFIELLGHFAMQLQKRSVILLDLKSKGLHDDLRKCLHLSNEDPRVSKVEESLGKDLARLEEILVEKKTLFRELLELMKRCAADTQGILDVVQENSGCSPEAMNAHNP